MTRPALPLRYVSPEIPRSSKAAHVLLRHEAENVYTLCGRKFYQDNVYFSHRGREMCANCWRIYKAGVKEKL